MQYFKQKKAEKGHERKFFVPVNLDDPDDEDDLVDSEPVSDAVYAYEDEVTERRKDTFRILAGLGDFAGVVAGTIAILLLLAVLISLLNWVYADMVQSFDLWQPRL